jgi:hypothetical protein
MKEKERGQGSVARGSFGLIISSSTCVALAQSKCVVIVKIPRWILLQEAARCPFPNVYAVSQPTERREEHWVVETILTCKYKEDRVSGKLPGARIRSQWVKRQIAKQHNRRWLRLHPEQ